MTRETKIGLLVGLAFIIVIGILLSDHLTSSTEPPQAPLVGVGGSVRSGVATPGSNNPPITTVITPPIAIVPEQPVPLIEDLAPRPAPPIEIVRVEAPAQDQPTQITQPQPLSGDIRSSEPAVTQTPVNSNLTTVAQQHGEAIVPIGSSQQQTTALPASAGPREYKAQDGDTLSKLAGRFLGSNSKANREAIVRLNPSLQQNPDRVIVGRTYLIPAVGTNSAAVTEMSATPRPAQPEVQLARDTVAPRRAEPEYWYTVKPNDSLWRIAEDQLGDPNAMNAIIELNKDILKGSTTVHPDMKLRLPAKPVASIS